MAKKSIDVQDHGKIAGVVELQVTVNPRGRSVALITIATVDGKLHPMSKDLDVAQVENVKKLIFDMFQPDFLF